MAKEVYYSEVYKNRPDYADFEPALKFQAISGIIARRLREHPNAICSYSGGADSDIMLDLIEWTRSIIPSLPKVKYVFFNTGLEMKATKDHVKEISEKYGVKIQEAKSNPNIIQAVRKYGTPFYSKVVSRRFEEWQRHPEITPLVYYEYENSLDKLSKYTEIIGKYPNCRALIQWITGTKADGLPGTNNQLSISSIKYFVDFLSECPPDFKISSKCCDVCKKKTAHGVQKEFELIITGERESEGGQRTTTQVNGSKCFYTDSKGQFRLRPLYYVSDADKAWYEEEHGIKYSDAYEVYGLTRTGCCGCPISYKAVEDLEKIGKYEPNVAKAAWAIFGKSYEYRMQYNEYKKRRMEEEKKAKIKH